MDAQMHAPQLELLPVDSTGKAAMATHVAVRDGDWFDPHTWAGGKVPGTGAIVHIPEGVSVDYEGASDAKLFLVRVDGDLSFGAANGGATKMVVDTMVTSAGSTLTVDASAPTDGTVDIVFAEGRPAAHRDFYTDHSVGDGVIGRYDWDPQQLSLGLVASGSVEVHGRDVEGSLRIERGPGAGATKMTLDAPDGDPGWAVGQKIVVGGMGYDGVDAQGQMQPQDEVRTIVDVRYASGRVVVELDEPLKYDHRGPADPATGQEITGHVGNLSRNVTFSSAVADPDGDGMADRGLSLDETKGAGDHYVTERGHVMFMHNDNVAVTDSAFFGLGRTDKSTDVDDYVLGGSGNHRLHADNGTPDQYDPDVDTEIATATDELTNQRGRYALHIHQAGTGGGGDMGGMGGRDGDQDADGTPDSVDADYFDGAYIEGNVIWGSPGWGVVQHDSAAELIGNVAFDVAGSAFVAESGSETGRWEGNLAVGTYGAGVRPEGDDASDFNEDGGYAGNGFYLKSRAIEVVDNTAQSSARAGFYYHNHGVQFNDTPIDALDGIAIGDGTDAVHTEDVPIRTFEGNEVFAAKQGIRIVTDPLDSVRKYNDAWSHLKDFTAVNVDESGVSVTYSSKYIFENFNIIGTEDKVTPDAQRASAGFFLKASVADVTVRGGSVENFGNAVINWSMVGDRQEYRRGYWDPKDPTADSPDTSRYDGMGSVEGIDNPAHNLWDTNIIGLKTANIDGVRWRLPGMEVETEPGVYKTMNGGLVLGSAPTAKQAIDVELLGDSRDGGLVALWREDLANDPDQQLVLARATPLAYQETAYLSHLYFEDGGQVRRHDFTDGTPGLTADIWSGTALEFAKTDSLGRQVFMYGDFAPVDPAGSTRTATTNEKILFTRDMIDGVLARDGYMMVGGIPDVRFVVMKMAFTDRLTGVIENKQFLVALDRAWQVPAGAKDNGLLLITDDMIVAPEYRVFEKGALVNGRAPIVFEGASGFDEIGRTAGDSGLYTTDGQDMLALGNAADKLRGGGGNDRVLAMGGDDSVDAGGGDDEVFGGDGNDLIAGGTGNDLLRGDNGRDVISGEDGDDVLRGGAGADVLKGGNGSDVLLGDDGDDVLDGGAGGDTMLGGDGNDLMKGGAEDDFLNGNAGQDEFYGEDGRDTLIGSYGEDTLFGGAGSDVLRGQDDADRLYGGDGRDALDGGEGDDRLSGDADNDRLLGGGGADWMSGGGGNDMLLGDSGDDTLMGDDGDDVLKGGDGDDLMFGGAGADRINGGDGNDTMLGGDANDRLDGSIGDDFLNGDAGHDFLRGGVGQDTLIGSSGNDHLFGDAGNDLLRGQSDDDDLHGGGGDDLLDGGDGDDQLFGNAGNDRLEGGAGRDRMNGGADDDLLLGGDGNDLLRGGDGDDVMKGGNDDDMMFGDAGADRMQGGAGDDIMLGGTSDDFLEGEAGDDFLQGDRGRDELHGGDGNDRLIGSFGNDRLFGDAGDDLLRGQFDDDELHGGAGNDVLDGGTGDDRLFGDAGTDRLLGGAGADWMSGGDDDDLLLGADGADTLLGDAGDDHLRGGAGADVLKGGTGDDRLDGGEGDDRLEGGAGRDRFVFDDSPGTDIITDFEDGVDAIDFLIGSFGFEDLQITQEGADAVLTHTGGTIRLLDTDAGQLDQDDFHFYHMN